MTKLNMRLTDNDKIRIQKLKEKYGFVVTPELIRYLLAKEEENL